MRVYWRFARADMTVVLDEAPCTQAGTSVVLDGRSLTIEAVVAVARNR
jgi:hypothetical protein